MGTKAFCTQYRENIGIFSKYIFGSLIFPPQAMILLAPVGELVLGDVPALRMVLTAKFQGYYELLQLSWFPRKICAQVDKFLNSYRSALMRAIPVL